MQAFYSTRSTLDSCPLMQELTSHIGDLLNHPSVLKLDTYAQHLNTSRLQHVFNVTYYSFRCARLFKLDVKATVRAAMLHDFFLYDWRTEQPIAGSHIDVHPQIALETAQSITEVSPLMKDIITSHMWPLGRIKPQSKEAYLVQAMDKVAALVELSTQVKRRVLKTALSASMITFIFFFM